MNYHQKYIKYKKKYLKYKYSMTGGGNQTGIIENRLQFTYSGISYNFVHNKNDASGPGSIREIVTKNEYILDQFKNIKNGSIIDIGANYGVATIILAKQNPESIIYTFEPDPDVYIFLVKNIHENGLTNVKPFNEAVSKKGINNITLHKHPLFSGGNTTYSNIDLMEKHFKNNIKTVSIKCTSLDEIVDKNNIKSIDLLKIDCEGAEFDIIYGSEYIKNNIIKNIIGEFHDLMYNNINNKSHDLVQYCNKFIHGIKKISVLKI